PVARLTTARRPVVVAGRVEVVDDEVVVLDGDREVARFREIEAEVVADGGADLLPALVERLVAAGADPAAPVPKLVRALGERAAAPPELVPVEVPDDPLVADVAAAALVDAVREARAGDLLVTADPGKGVLALRRGLRLARSALRTLAPVLDREVSEPVRDAAGWAVDALTPARLAERVAATVGVVAVGAPAARAAEERTAAAGAAAAALDGEPWLRLLDDLVALAADPPRGPEAGASAAEVLPRMVAGAWSELAAAVGGDPADAPPDRLRRLVTAARDAAELAVPGVGDPAAALSVALGRVRRVLGDHRDALLAADWLAAAGEDPAPARARAEEATARWPAAWADAVERAAWLA
ncbi:MAG TPA: CHAD domain-containing protein, partial [Acidimicrobiales bacterium]